MTNQEQLPTDRRELQAMMQKCIDDNTSDGYDVLTAFRLARAQNPALYAALLKAISPEPETTTPLANADLASLPRFTEDDLDALGLSRNVSLPVVTAAWNAGNNSLNPDYADAIFDAVVSAVSDEACISRKGAEQVVRTNSRGLAKRADALRAKKELGGSLPPVSDPARPQFSAKPGMSTDFQKPFNQDMTVRNPFTPENAKAILGNDMSQRDVRKTYAAALAKHMDENPDHGPIRSHREVMASHPELARALREGKPGEVVGDKDDASADASNPSNAAATTDTSPEAFAAALKKIDQLTGKIKEQAK